MFLHYVVSCIVSYPLCAFGHHSLKGCTTLYCSVMFQCFVTMMSRPPSTCSTSCVALVASFSGSLCFSVSDLLCTCSEAEIKAQLCFALSNLLRSWGCFDQTFNYWFKSPRIVSLTLILFLIFVLPACSDRGPAQVISFALCKLGCFLRSLSHDSRLSCINKSLYTMSHFFRNGLISQAQRFIM